jgi:SAM-dependent methyltransferase
MATVGASRFTAYDACLRDRGLNPRNVRYRARWLFHGVELEGASVLDVGAGVGLLSLYAACAGAARVVSLEPDGPGSGSRGPAGEAYLTLASRLGVDDRTVFVPLTLQAYEPDDPGFDVVLLHASVNHLDEDACTRLREDADARQAYARIFDKLARLCRPGAAVIVTDAARRNLFGDLHLRNPLAPSIDWRKHQQPELWAELLAERGFHSPRINWASPNALRRPGRLLLGHRATAYCLRSGFCLRMRRLAT